MTKNQASGRTKEATDALIGLLDIGERTPGASELRARSYELLGIAPDAAVVDVGCGTGRAGRRRRWPSGALGPPASTPTRG